MTGPPVTGSSSRASSTTLVMAAMIFAVAMMFIDQTIVAIAAPQLQQDLELSSTGLQWIINGYLLSLSALFALGGRFADMLGHRRMVIVGVIVFAIASALCGATPTSGIGEAWIIAFRIIQGAGAAIMFPAALAIVVAAFPVSERGRALAVFFAVTGGLTAIGPIAGGYLTEWTWRSIFWVNVPVAIVALILTSLARPADTRAPAPVDYRGAVLIAAGMGLAVLGLQQSSTWGWDSPVTWICIVAGLALIALFVRVELRTAEPVMRLRIFASRAFAVDNIVLFLLMIPFVAIFLFGSMYAQLSLGQSASESGLYLLIFFAGFAVAAQFGGRILDLRGARPSAVLGCLLAAVGFALWASEMTDLSVGSQWYYIVLTGAGFGLLLGPVSTDALNRAARGTYGEVTGITQTVRNFASSLGLAVLGTILIAQNKSHIESSLGGLGIGRERADAVAHSLSQSAGGSPAGFSEHAGANAQRLFEAVQGDFAVATQTVFYVMAGVMAAGFIVALVAMPRGRVEGVPESLAAEPVASGDGT